jgi:uncharacterized glyoxalase superfamily protein PhnB
MENYQHQTLTPSLTVNDAEAAIAFYERIFGAQVEGEIMRSPNGKSVGHAELRFGNMKIFVNDEFADMGCFGPTHYGGSSVSLHVYVPDTDRTYAAALAVGATSVMPPADQFWGDRYAVVTDPFGYRWGIATVKEVLTPEQIKQRAAQYWKQPVEK